MCAVCSFCNFSAAVLLGAINTGSCPDNVTKISVFMSWLSALYREIGWLSVQPDSMEHRRESPGAERQRQVENLGKPYRSRHTSLLQGGSKAATRTVRLQRVFAMMQNLPAEF